jgi:hypothetical protein
MSGNASGLRARLSAVVPGFARELVRTYRTARRAKERRALFVRSVRPDDTFLVGHPKSGNTWLAYMLAVLVRGDRDNRINIANIGDYAPVVHVHDHAIAKYGQLPSPRIFRNEGPAYPDLYPKTIYIVRDPRAVLVSYYHHCVHDTGEADWAMDAFVDEMLAHGCIRRLEPTVIRWDTQVQDWIRRAETQPVKLVRYEDLKADRKAVLAELAAFMDFECDEDALDFAAARGDFNSMRSEEKTYGAESYAGEKGARGFFVRKGKVDSWRDELPAGAVARIEGAFGATMRQLGYL